MKIATTQRRITVDRRPLQLSGSIEIKGTVPASQSYDSATRQHTPDYALTPLVLYPRCAVTDPDTMSAASLVNHELGEITWHRVADGVRTLVASSPEPGEEGTAVAGYTLEHTGGSRGRLTIGANDALPQRPATYEFAATYADPLRAGQAYRFSYTRLVGAKDVTAPASFLIFDRPSVWSVNPLRDSSYQDVYPTLHIGGKPLPYAENKAHIRFFFYLRKDGTDTLLDTSSDVYSAYSDRIRIKRYFTNGRTYVVRASYNPTGTPAAQPDPALGEAMTTVSLHIPPVEVDYTCPPPYTGTDGRLYVRPKAILRDTAGVVDRRPGGLWFRWYTRARGASAWTLAASTYGTYIPTIPYTPGMELKVEVEYNS